MSKTEYYVVSSSHIDMAFLMREEAQAEMIDMLLERVIGVLERNSEIHFALEQVAHYRNLKERRPDLFAKVKELLREGRLEFMGGMATTAETNLPGGESLVRNQGMGLLWLEKNLDVKPRSGWLIDTFGLNAQIPQIFTQFGFTDLYANRFGGNKRYDLFEDEGIDGSRIRIIGKDGMSINTHSASQAFVFCRNWGDIDRLYRFADSLKSELPKLVTYYVENEEMFSEYYIKLANQKIEDGGAWKHSSYGEYSDVIEAADCQLPVLGGDLNPEFTGTYALRTPIKTENRRAETLLLEAEKWAALLDGEGRGGHDGEFEECWWNMFFCQFHDVFTGSHEDMTYLKVLKRYADICDTSKAALADTLKIERDGEGIVCCNGLPWARKAWAELDADANEGDVYEVFDGADRVPTAVKNGKILFFADVPAGGIKRFRLAKSANTPNTAKVSGNTIGNEYFRLTLSEDNGIESLTDMDGNGFISQAPDFLIMEEDSGGMQIESCSGKILYAFNDDSIVEDAVKDELGESIAMRGTIPSLPWTGGASLTWSAEFSLRKHERAVRLRITLNWTGDKTRIRLRLPLSIRGRDVYYEIPFGVIRRDAYKNLPTAKGEWPVQRFAAMEDGERGVALINKGVAGVEQEGSALETTLIRAYGSGWITPSPLSSQHGEQVFEFMLAPYTGDYKSAEIIRLAQEFNEPITALPGKSPYAGAQSLFEIKERNLVLSAVKKAWDGSDDIIMRVYEAEGVKTEGNIKIKGFGQGWLSDVRETKGALISCENTDGESLRLEFAPFEIKTIRIRRNEMPCEK